MCSLIWSKLSYVLGLFHPTNTGFDPPTELAIRKAFFDHMWDLPFATVVDVLSIAPASPPAFNQLANKLNTGNHQNAHE